jgi:hypothetical protein
MSREINLHWRGPFRFGTGVREALPPPNTAGVYVWVLKTDQGQHRVSYVGMAQDILWRWREHVRWTLGGGYRLYDVSQMRRGILGEVVYQEIASEDVLIEFVAKHTQLAVENLLAFDLYWASVDTQDSGLLRSIESCLIDRVVAYDRSQGGRFLQNERLSVVSSNALQVMCHSIWPTDVQVEALMTPMQYGEL